MVSEKSGETQRQYETERKKRLVMLGTNLFASEVADLAEDTGDFDLVAFIENLNQKKVGKTFVIIQNFQKWILAGLENCKASYCYQR
jgi:hypothetical protein